MIFKFPATVGMEHMDVPQITLNRRKSPRDRVHIFVRICDKANDFAVKEVNKDTYVMPFVFYFHLCQIINVGSQHNKVQSPKILRISFAFEMKGEEKRW